jgi:hypothetical protein
MNQDTGLSRKKLADKFYTVDAVAKKCVDTLMPLVENPGGFAWIEPSAGAGAFLKHMTLPVHAIDIEPEGTAIVKADFFTWVPPEGPRIFFGNPPFGRQASMARKFMARAAELDAAWIAFILPRSFEKPSLQTCMPPKYHLVHSERVVENAFLVNGVPHDVPCVYQIWQKKAEERVVEVAETPVGFSFVKSGDPYDFVIRRVGVYAGKAFAKGPEFSPQSHYFIRATEKVPELVQKTCEHVFPSNTTGPRSLSKGEITQFLNPLIASLGPSTQ